MTDSRLVLPGSVFSGVWVTEAIEHFSDIKDSPADSFSGCDAGYRTLPGHLPDRPDHAGHCSSGLH